MNVISLILLTTAFTNFLLGSLIFWKERKNRANLFFFLLTTSIAVWSISIFLFRQADSARLLLIWGYVAHLAAAATPFFFSYFTLSFPRSEKIRNLWHLSLLGSFSLLVFLLLKTKLIIEKVIIIDGTRGLLFGDAYLFYMFFIFFFFSLSFAVLIFQYSRAPFEIKQRLKYIFLGGIPSIVIASLTNLVLFGRGSFQYNWIGPTSTIFMVTMIAYAIIKYHLFNIKVITTELLTSILVIVLFLNIFNYTSISYLFLNVFIFLGTSVAGLFLVKSVVWEIDTREKMEKMALDLQVAYSDLKRLDEAKSEFISIASHQLRTPLSAIKGYISLLLEGSYGRLAEKEKRPLENVYQANERLIALVNDLLDVSRIEAGRVELEKEETRLEEVVANAIQILKIKAEQKNLFLKFEKPKEALPAIRLDKEKIAQAVVNIVDNAIRYTSQGGVTILLRPAADPKKLLIEIKDTGAGMDKQELAELFKSFSRGKAGGRYWTEGAGLGLYVAQKFIGLHRGRVWAESAGQGKGSTFYIELPINEP